MNLGINTDNHIFLCDTILILIFLRYKDSAKISHNKIFSRESFGR